MACAECQKPSSKPVKPLEAGLKGDLQMASSTCMNTLKAQDVGVDVCCKNSDMGGGS